MDINQEIISVASHFLNLHEIKANAMWADSNSSEASLRSQELTEAMRACGWQAGWAYCMAFSEAVWRLSYINANASEDIKKLIADMLCPHVMTSVRAVGKRLTTDPIPGSIFFMQKGNTSQGHAGIVARSDSRSIYTIEANTSPAATTAMQDREGDGIYKKIRALSFARTKGLWLKGFLNPIALSH